MMTKICGAQENLDSAFKQQFNNFKQGITDEFEKFQHENDSIYAQFLEDSWQSFQLVYNDKKEKPKPPQQPRMDTIKKIKPKSNQINNPAKLKIELRKNDKKEIRKDAINNTTPGLIYHGTPTSIYKIKSNFPRLTDVNDKAITAYFIEASKHTELNDLVVQVIKSANEINLNDWGLIDLLRESAKTLYKRTENRKLFIWYALLQSGINAKIGFNEANLYLLVPSSIEIYNTYTFDFEDQKYYLIELYDQAKGLKQLYSHKADYPEARKTINLLLKSIPLLNNKEVISEIKANDTLAAILINKNLVDFYETYPLCDLSVYLTASFSSETKHSLDQVLIPMLKGKDKLSQVNLLLDFVQQLPYKTDQEQFGKEKFLFCEQTIFYQYSDCEDRSVLFANLVHRYTGLKSILLDYPDHISVAVNLPEKIAGHYIDFNSERFYFSDPTYIGARTGMIMPKYRDTQAKIIDNNQIESYE